MVSVDNASVARGSIHFGKAVNVIQDEAKFSST